MIIDFKEAKKKREQIQDKEWDHQTWTEENILALADDILIDFIEMVNQFGFDHREEPKLIRDMFAMHISFVSAISRLTKQPNEFTIIIDRLFVEQFGDVPDEELHNILSFEDYD